MIASVLSVCSVFQPRGPLRLQWDAGTGHFRGMSTTRSVRLRALCGPALVTLLCGAALGQTPTRFTITELPTLGGDASRGVGVNNSGLVCGESNLPNLGYLVATAWLPPDHHPMYLTGSGGSVAT